MRKSEFIVQGHNVDMEYDGYLTAFVDGEEVYCEDTTGEDECLDAIEDALGFELSENVRHFQAHVIVDYLINNAHTIGECLDIQRAWEERNQKVVDENGREIDYEAAVQLMDDDLRERIHALYAPCLKQEFLEQYSKAHELKFGEPFAPYAGLAW